MWVVCAGKILSLCWPGEAVSSLAARLPARQRKPAPVVGALRTAALNSFTPGAGVAPGGEHTDRPAQQAGQRQPWQQGNAHS